MIQSALHNADLQSKTIHLQKRNVKLHSHYLPQEIDLFPNPQDFQCDLLKLTTPHTVTLPKDNTMKSYANKISFHLDIA